MSDVDRASRRLVPGQDLHIIGCARPETMASGTPCLGIRWAARVDLGFPISGYRIARRRPNESTATELGLFFLPETTAWSVFADDAKRRRPRCGPWFDAIEEKHFADLLPVIRFCDPRVPAAEAPALIERAAAFFGDTHRSDAELAFSFWRFGPLPTLGELLNDPQAATALERFYRRQCLALLLVLTLRFEYAALFGLATDDEPGEGAFIYHVRAVFAGADGGAESDPVLTGARCDPPPPAWLAAERVPGSVLYPSAALWPKWQPPAELAPTDDQGLPLPASAGWPRVPAALTGLSWAEPLPETKLIGHGPVLYRVGRYGHGAASATFPISPPLPAGADFTMVGDGEDMIRGRQPPHLIDTPGMAWPPLEGHYAYEARGVDLLGVASSAGTRTSLRHHRDLPPPPPRAANLGEPVVTLDPQASHVDVPLRITWGSAEDFGGPSVTEFRIAASWRDTLNLAVEVESAAEAGPLHADLSIASLVVPAGSLVGALLSLPNGDFPIVGHGSGAHAGLRVRQVHKRLPEVGFGRILAPGTPTPVTRIARLPRRPMVPASIAAVASLDPLDVELVAVADQIPGDDAVTLYLHLLGADFMATRVGPQLFRIAAPRADTPAHARWSEWLALADPPAALVGSPVLLFPPHPVIASVAVPPGFRSGTLSFQISAADDADYVASPVLPVADPALADARGNESARTTVTLSLRSLAPPPPVGVDPFDPSRRLWARSAAAYAEDATYALSWPAIAGAARYEVWRVLETAVPGVGPATSDGELRSLAATAARFILRRDQVFAPAYVDRIPGRAPVRALYRVRAVSPAGVPGDFSEIIGPVHVPDVRAPAAPNLLRVAPLPPEEAERAILVEWTALAGSDIRFEVWFAEAAASDGRLQLAGALPVGSVPDADGRFRFVHADRRPGRTVAYEVRAVREALDPVDPGATVTRDIASVPSRQLLASALRSGPLVAPEITMVAASAEGGLHPRPSGRAHAADGSASRLRPGRQLADIGHFADHPRLRQSRARPEEDRRSKAHRRAQHGLVFEDPPHQGFPPDDPGGAQATHSRRGCRDLISRLDQACGGRVSERNLPA